MKGISRRDLLKISASAIGSILLPWSTVEELSTLRTDNSIAEENRQPGSVDWIIRHPLDDIEGFAYPPSMNRGENVDFYVNTRAARFDLHIFRIGYYSGTGGRLMHSIKDVPGVAQPAPYHQRESGLISCTNWSSNCHFTLPADWLSGIYMAKFVRADSGGESYALFVVRDDTANADILCQQSLFTYHAYNRYGSKSLYTFNSEGCSTISGTTRAVSVSMHRPYGPGMGIHANSGNNFFTVEYGVVRWLEQQGYSTSYSTNLDTHHWGGTDTHNRLLDHLVFLSVGHDEYWTQNIRDAVTTARDRGVHIGILSANTGYWRVRLDVDPWTNTPDSVIVCYKTTESGPADPSGHSTTTWRDPSGVNQPENALLGAQYIGDNDGLFFPLRISAEEGQDRLFRHTDLQTMPARTFLSIGEQIVGWEWDAIHDNGFTPPETHALASTPVYGFLLRGEGNYQLGATGTGLAQMTRYVTSTTHPSIVFNSGTILWGWGLGVQDIDVVETNPYIQQITYNLLADMGVLPTSPTTDLILDGMDTVLTSPSNAFVSLDAPHPLISSISAETSSTDFMMIGRVAVINWNTNTETIGQVWLGSTPEQTVSPRSNEDRLYAVEHHLSLTNLLPNTTYYYRILVIDRYGLITVSEVRSFSTPPNLLVSTGSPILNAFRSGRCWVEQNPVLAATTSVGGAAALILLMHRLMKSFRPKKT